jgi:hypothetical protein
MPRIAEVLFQLLAAEVEGVGDVFEEDEAEDGVFVNGGIEVGAEAVGGVPEFFVQFVEEGLFVGGGVLGHG